LPTATILVTDLVGSTELRARLGEEAADQLHRLHDRLLRDAVEAHGGVAVKGLGDGILGSFTGAAEAVACAIAIQQAADSHTRRHPDQALIVRVGLSVGDVTIEEDGDRIGTPVVEASRLCAAARGGQILAAELVRALTRGRGGHEFSVVGELDLKGLPEPVATVEITWEPASSTLPFPELLRATGGLGFAGRASELEVLEGAWKEAAAGGRRSVLVAGEPGVGKTRLAAELARSVHEAGGAVFYGRCEEDLGVPYEPFVEALTFFCEHTPPADLRHRLGRYPGELARLLPDLGEVVPGLDPPLQSDPETEQYRLFEAVASWLAAAGEAAGLVVVVDDLHWAPPPTIHLLAHVLRAATAARLLVVGTFRDTEVGPAHPLSVVLADLRRISGVERISLGGLSVDELTELLEAVPRGQGARALAAALYEGTEGNPFFVGEVLRNVAESDLALEALPVPEGVREVIVFRASRLSAPTRELLGVASVLGRNFDLASLAAVAGVPEDGAVRGMDEALVARLVEETEVGAYRFVHALVRSALYEGLSATRRARLHLRAADVVEGGDDPARLAHHLIASASMGDSTRTAQACLAAGDRALVVLADAEAADWYSQGLAILPAGEDPGLRMDLLTGLGEAQRRTGDAAFRQTLLDAARLAADDRDVPRLVRAVLANNRGFASVIGDVDEERLGLIQTALDLVGPEASRDRAELLALQASELVFAGDHVRVLRAADEAGAIAARLDDLVRVRVAVRRFQACMVPDRVTAMASECAEVARLADASGDPQPRLLSRLTWAWALLQTGDLRQGRRRAAEAMAVADEIGEPGLRSLTHLFYATALDALGQHGEAERLTQAALELGQQAGWPDAVMLYGGRMAVAWMFEGQVQTAGAVVESAIAEYPRIVAWQGGRALGLAILDREAELADFLAGLPSLLPTVPVDYLWLAAHFLFAAAQGFGVHDRDSAAATYDALLPYRALHAAYGTGYLGPVEVALAVLARALGDHDLALAHHEAAAATIEACGAARARALNGYQWARTLLARDAPGDRQRALNTAEETLTYCRTKGYTTFVTKTEELLATM
jgi:class 3 adenylate cyclase/tetratricopeptide (TPR) repeat protein